VTAKPRRQCDDEGAAAMMSIKARFHTDAYYYKSAINNLACARSGWPREKGAGNESAD
jgi:hypothetical protein